MRACVPIITKVLHKKVLKMKKKGIFFLWVKKVCYLWFIINIKTYNNGKFNNYFNSGLDRIKSNFWLYFNLC